MQKRFITMTIALITLFSPAAFGADGYFSAGAGIGLDTYNLSIEGGAKGIKYGYRTYLLGAGIPLLPHGYDNVPSNTYSYPCPHSDYSIQGEEYDGTELGFFAKAGMETVWPGTYLSLLLGFTRVTEIQVAESNTTGRLYEQSSDKKVNILYGVGVSCFKEMFDDDWRVTFQLDLDSRRGLTGSIGFYW